MRGNVDYTFCPECMSINAAMWHPTGERSYEVRCTVCGYEFEHGHYASQLQRDVDGGLQLTHEEIEAFFQSGGWARHREEDYDD